MEWQNLSGVAGDALKVGTVFRCSGKDPYEKIVDFMLIEYPESPSGLAFLVSSGSRAGHLLVKLPKESRPHDSLTQKVSMGWLRKNWKDWVYQAELDQVKVLAPSEAS